MTFVLDSSVALTWAFEDEATPETEVLFDRARQDGAVVPDLWHIEVANVIVGAERRGRVTPEKVALFRQALSALRLTTDGLTGTRAFSVIRTLALAERLTAYDATYLDLAMRRGLPLAIRDKDLRHAAHRRGIDTLG
jgi:predicted nucleic acid-binding protein